MTLKFVSEETFYNISLVVFPYVLCLMMYKWTTNRVLVVARAVLLRCVVVVSLFLCWSTCIIWQKRMFHDKEPPPLATPDAINKTMKLRKYEYKREIRGKGWSSRANRSNVPILGILPQMNSRNFRGLSSFEGGRGLWMGVVGAAPQTNANLNGLKKNGSDIPRLSGAPPLFSCKWFPLKVTWRHEQERLRGRKKPAWII